MNQEPAPEAYTKDFLSEAFHWLQTQPESLKELVHTPDHLITLFRQHKKQVRDQAPVSSKQFVSELKNLAKGLDAFSSPAVPSEAPISEPSPIPPPQGRKGEPGQRVHQEPLKSQSQNEITPPSKPHSPEKNLTNTPPLPSASFPATRDHFEDFSENFSPSPRPKEPTLKLDKLSGQYVTEIQESLNFSSEEEALRVLIAIGYKKLKQI